MLDEEFDNVSDEGLHEIVKTHLDHYIQAALEDRA